MSEVKNQVEADIPFGAIENGRAFMDRVENHYDFTCEAGPLVSCYEWQEARRCFEHLALWASNAAHTDRATLLRLLDAAREELREVREAVAPGMIRVTMVDARGLEVGFTITEEAASRLAAALKEPKP